LMERFAILYGWQKVKAQFADDDNTIMAAQESWQNLLEKQRPGVVKRVLSDLESHPREWPPNLTEFAAMCNVYARQMATEQPALPAPKHVTAEGKAALQRMKEMLESKKVRL
jgi:hypothetical protein